MSRGKKPVLRNVLIESVGAEGNAIARVDNMVIFVPMVIPGDIVDIRVTRKRRKYMEGKPLFFHKYSEKRVKPVCEHFGVCGGCKWQHLSYADQLKYKERQVEETLKRIGKIDNIQVQPILASEKTEAYRNKLEYTFSSNKWFSREEIDSDAVFNNTNAAGFHLPGMYDKVLDINKCWLQAEPGNAIRNFIKKYGEEKKLKFYDTKNHNGFLRNLIIRNSSTSELMIIVVFGEEDRKTILDLLEAVKQSFPEITSLLYAVNRKKNDTLFDQQIICYTGKEYITEKMEDLSFRIGPKSFFQTNTAQALKLYQKIREFADLTGRENVYDLYTGTGTIANFVAKHAEVVIGMESVPEAVADAGLNSKLNGISNTRFFTGDIKDILSEAFIAEHGKPDIIITDPPRAGMHADVLRAVSDAAPEKIIYVSCNPSTQARDVTMLSGLYNVAAVQPVDMFPHTHHVENIVVMVKN